MIRMRHIGLIMLLLVLTACGANSSAGASQTATAELPQAGTEQGPTPTAAPEPQSGPVTAVMQSLEITGEPFATEGDPNAPVTLIEFTDYGCPFCRRHAGTTYPALRQEYIDTGKVYYVLKDYPIVELHPQAYLASEAAECAGEQGKYWIMHATLFSTPSEWDTTEAVARESFSGYAEEIGLDTARFDDCMTSGRFRSAIATNISEGRRFGVTGTPTFIINGKLLIGAQTSEVFERVIERELNQ